MARPRGFQITEINSVLTRIMGYYEKLERMKESVDIAESIPLGKKVTIKSRISVIMNNLALIEDDLIQSKRDFMASNQ